MHEHANSTVLEIYPAIGYSADILPLFWTNCLISYSL